MYSEDEKVEILKAYRKLLRAGSAKFKKGDKKKVRLAFDMALEGHQHMRRKSGEPYIFHPIAVAQIVAEEIGLGTTGIICALLHDVIEDTEISYEDIQKVFGDTIANIVEGLTKFAGVFDVTSSMQAENFRKLLLTLANDVRVVLIKFADRLHNMRTLGSMPRRKQLKIASETSYIYAPLAHRMGLYNIKNEFEDICLKITSRKQYDYVAENLDATKNERAKFIKNFIDPIKKKLEEQTDLEFDVFGRAKSISSISNKLIKKDIAFEEIYDLFAIRVVIDVPKRLEKAKCWEVYSILTDLYQPNPHRLKDWVSTPKSNGYESLHTTVMSDAGKWVEVQIRSQRMDEIAEKGLAAHWKYKEGSSDSAIDEWLGRVREMLQNPEGDALDFINDFKSNLFSEEIFVFTPNGELKILPSGATALDFAYDIHSEVGDKCLGAKVNHKLIPLSQALKNGDQVEILTSKKQKPVEDWLKYVITSKARNRIRKKLNEEKNLIAEDGKEMLERKFKQLKVTMNYANAELLMNYLDLKSHQDLFYRIGAKKQSLAFLKKFTRDGSKLVSPVVEKIVTTPETINQPIQKNTELVIFGEDSDKIDYSFANCCNPIKGDDVFGFLTTTGGLKIHRVACPNAVQMMSKFGYRIVKARWTYADEVSFLTGIQINGIDDVGVINKISSLISGKLKINMRSISIDSRDGIFEGQITLFVNSIEELDELLVELEQVKAINKVTRLFDTL